MAFWELLLSRPLQKNKTKVHGHTKKSSSVIFFPRHLIGQRGFSRRVIVFRRGTSGRHTDLACDTVVLRRALA